MNLPKNLPRLNSKDLNPTLSGLFYTSEEINFGPIVVLSGAYVYLKDGLLHNEEGPAVIEKRAWASRSTSAPLWILQYFHKNSPVIKRPFRILDYSYSHHPSIIILNNEPIWNERQFSYCKEDVKEFEFLNSNFVEHNLEGPAVHCSNPEKYNNYYINGDWISEAMFFERIEKINKEAILKIIQSA